MTITDGKIKEDALIAELRLEGKTLREIGKITGRTKDTIAKRLKKEHVRKLLEYGARREAMRIPAACDTLDQLLQSEDEGIRMKVAEITLKNMGIASPHASIFIQNIYHDQRIQLISPHVQEILHQHLGQVIDGEVIEDVSQTSESDD